MSQPRQTDDELAKAVLKQMAAFASAAVERFPRLESDLSREAYIRGCVDLYLAEKALAERALYRFTWSDGRMDHRQPGVPYFWAHPEKPGMLIRWLDGVEQAGNFVQGQGWVPA